VYVVHSLPRQLKKGFLGAYWSTDVGERMQALVRAGAKHAVIGVSEQRINGPRRILQDTDRRHTMARSNVKMIERRARQDKRKVNDRRRNLGIEDIREKVDGILAMSLEDIVGTNYISPYLDGIDNGEQAAHVNHEENADMEANAEEVEGGDGTGAMTEEEVAENNNN